MVESNSNEILRDSDITDVAFLVVGDPFASVSHCIIYSFNSLDIMAHCYCRATTHIDLLMRAACDQGIKVKAIHNASIMNAVAACGLQLYQFGQTVSIPFFQDNWRPDSFYEKIKINQNNGFHTLCLLGNLLLIILLFAQCAILYF